MIDDICVSLLNFLSKECEGNKYKILSLEEIVSILPEKYRLSDEDARKYIYELVKLEFISLRYEDDKEICVALTVKGRALVQDRENKDKEKIKEQRKIFAYAFFGALLGSAIFFALKFLALLVRGLYAK